MAFILYFAGILWKKYGIIWTFGESVFLEAMEKL